MTRLRALPSTLVLWVVSTLYAIPILWFVLSSFKPGSELFSLPLSLFPKTWTLSGYETAWNRFDFQQYFINTATVAIITTILTVVVSAMTGYAFAKYKAVWLKVFFVCILATTMLPTEVIMPSSFIVVRDLGLYDTLAGIIVPSIITATGIFMFRQYFTTVPDELMEAARIDGVGEFRLFWRIMLPLARPIMIVLAIFSFQWRWNDYIWPLLILRDPKNYTLQVALRSIVGADNIDWSVLLAASIISLIPMVLLFIVFQRYIVSADINSGLKD
ncbi:alpha-1,4-digalacturonate transport system permease protein [Salana multivorans]|uniref:Alpha-1,4-digalacturonate transport system permease protein n=1 Tax=Salana multivorans TaxID=120377 RepID=A0A3N2DAB3_9MICO|nr:carbohydrate ABC transporter permease [Salana multivorans]MBN8881231.1 carbohydrate ABC transporter permease [Salana multivorans]OJX96896.1 MAG: sugar ABC transporter permease [Micrococcales bacterium 73-15]ROR96717.1 alpha-1,4-digalacturonate transport system permease protein [Salana multivorans]